LKPIGIKERPDGGHVEEELITGDKELHLGGNDEFVMSE